MASLQRIFKPFQGDYNVAAIPGDVYYSSLTSRDDGDVTRNYESIRNAEADNSCDSSSSDGSTDEDSSSGCSLDESGKEVSREKWTEVHRERFLINFKAWLILACLYFDFFRLFQMIFFNIVRIVLFE